MILPCGCPGDYPDWDGQDINLGGWLVHEQPTPMFMHMPLAFNLYRHKQNEDIIRLGLKERWPGFTLTKSVAFRGRHLRLLEDDPCPARRVHRLPNPFRMRVVVHQGDVGGIRPLVGRMQTELVQSACMPKEIYLSYLTCPNCAEDRGGAKVMILRHWLPSKKLKEKLEKRKAKR